MARRNEYKSWWSSIQSSCFFQFQIIGPKPIYITVNSVVGPSVTNRFGNSKKKSVQEELPQVRIVLFKQNFYWCLSCYPAIKESSLSVKLVIRNVFKNIRR